MKEKRRRKEVQEEEPGVPGLPGSNKGKEVESTPKGKGKGKSKEKEKKRKRKLIEEEEEEEEEENNKTPSSGEKSPKTSKLIAGGNAITLKMIVFGKHSLKSYLHVLLLY